MSNDIPVFKIIEIGTFKSVGDLRKALRKSGEMISDWASNILNRISLSEIKQTLDLVVLSVAELGFPKGAELKDIYKAAEKHGLDLCPAEVGPQLRLQYPDQPAGEWLVIAMEPIKDSDGDLCLFIVEYDDADRWLRAYDGWPDRLWDADDRFVFIRRK